MYKRIKYIPRLLSAILIIALTLTVSLSSLRALFPLKHADLINKYCSQYEVDPYLVLSLIKVESNFDADALSSAGAKGLMQLTDETFAFCNLSVERDVSVEDIFTPQENIRAGVWYLKFLLIKYNGNTKSAIAAYNAGATNVDKWLRNPSFSRDGKVLSEIPFGETARHTQKTHMYYRIYKLLYPDIS